MDIFGRTYTGIVLVFG